MLEIRQTETYVNWFESLRDRQAKARIDIRIRRLSMGNPGDVNSYLAPGKMDVKTATTCQVNQALNIK